MNNINVAVILPNLGTGGAETQLVAIANQLGEEFGFHFILFSKHQPLASRLKNAHIRCFSSPINGLIGLPRLLRKLKCRIVVSSIIDMNLLVLAARPLFPSATRIIVREALDPTSAIRLTRFPGLYGWLYRKLYPKSDHIVSLSESMSKAISALIGPVRKAKIHVINNGVDQDRILPARPCFNPHRIIAVGRLDYQKGFDLLIQGFNKYLSQSANREATLTIYGEGPARRELERLIRSLDLERRIFLPGTDCTVIQVMQSSAFLVISSRFEGMSNVMLEALVNGVPVLSTIDKTSAEEVIDSSNGLLIPNGEPDTIAKGLARMFAKKSTFDRPKIAENALSRYSIQSVAAKYAEIFGALIEKP